MNRLLTVGGGTAVFKGYTAAAVSRVVFRVALSHYY